MATKMNVKDIIVEKIYKVLGVVALTEAEVKEIISKHNNELEIAKKKIGENKKSTILNIQGGGNYILALDAADVLTDQKSKSSKNLLEGYVLYKYPKQMYWQNPYIKMSYSYTTMKRYSGLNVLLLGGGEYMTFKALQEYNESHGTKYSIKAGSKSEQIVFFSEKTYKVTEQEKKKILNELGVQIKDLVNHTIRYGNDYYKVDDKGNLVKTYPMMKYSNVFNIGNIIDENGKNIEPKIKINKMPMSELLLKVEEILKTYIKKEGIRLSYDAGGTAYYSVVQDGVHLPLKEHYNLEGTSEDSNADYIRTMIHECMHSTGHTKRLNRGTLGDTKTIVYAKEELIAEIGSLIFASMCGMTKGTTQKASEKNSLAYVQNWSRWLIDNKSEIYDAVKQAQKAVDYIFNIVGITEEDLLDIQKLGVAEEQPQKENNVYKKKCKAIDLGNNKYLVYVRKEKTTNKKGKPVTLVYTKTYFEGVGGKVIPSELKEV